MIGSSSDAIIVTSCTFISCYGAKGGVIRIDGGGILQMINCLYEKNIPKLFTLQNINDNIDQSTFVILHAKDTDSSLSLSIVKHEQTCVFQKPCKRFSDDILITLL